MGIISFVVGCWPLAEASARRTANGERPTSFQTALDLARHFFDLLAPQLWVNRDSQRLFRRRFGVRKTAALQIGEALLLRKRAWIINFSADARALEVRHHPVASFFESNHVLVVDVFSAGQLDRQDWLSST